jgi:hypothetical protein
MYMEKYFFKINHRSEIQQHIFENKENYCWHTGRKNDQFQVKEFPQFFISQDKFLSYLSKKIPGTLKLFKFPPGCMYRWHQDGDNILNFNLMFKKQNALALFADQDAKQEDFHPALTPIIKLEYEPELWYLFNASIQHSVVNLDPEWRYLLTYTIPKTVDITYQEALMIAKEFGPS